MLSQGIENVPVPATPTTAQAYLNKVQNYINGVPGASGVKVPSVSTSTGNTVINNPPALPTTKTTTTTTNAPVTTPTTTTTSTTTTTTTSTTSTTSTTTTCVPSEITTSTTTSTTSTTTCAPTEITTSTTSTALPIICETTTTTTTSEPTNPITTTSIEPSTACSSEITSTDLPIICETTTTSTTTTTTCEPIDEVNVISEQLKEVITQLLSLLNELFKVTTSEQTRQLINILIYKLTGDGKDATSTTTNEDDTNAAESGAISTDGNSNTKDKDAEMTIHDATFNEQLNQLITKLIDLIGQPITSATIEEVIQLKTQLITQLTGENTSSTTGVNNTNTSTTGKSPPQFFRGFSMRIVFIGVL